MRHVLAVFALGTMLMCGVTTAPAQTTYPSTTPPPTQPSTQPSTTQPSPSQGSDTTTPAPSPSSAPAQTPGSQPATPAPGTQPAPAQTQPSQTQPMQPAQPSQTTPPASPSTQDTQAPAPAVGTTPENQIQSTPSKEMIDQQCYQGYGQQVSTSASVPQTRTVSAQSGGTPATQVDVSITPRMTAVPPRFCGGWTGAPAGRFPNVELTPEFPVMSSGGVEMLPLSYAYQRWNNFDSASNR